MIGTGDSGERPIDFFVSNFVLESRTSGGSREQVNRDVSSSPQQGVKGGFTESLAEFPEKSRGKRLAVEGRREPRSEVNEPRQRREDDCSVE